MGRRSAKTIGGSPATLFLYVENVDKVGGEATGLGATAQGPVMDMFWGTAAEPSSIPYGYSWIDRYSQGRTSMKDMKKKYEEQVEAMKQRRALHCSLRRVRRGFGESITWAVTCMTELWNGTRGGYSTLSRVSSFLASFCEARTADGEVTRQGCRLALCVRLLTEPSLRLLKNPPLENEGTPSKRIRAFLETQTLRCATLRQSLMAWKLEITLSPRYARVLLRRVQTRGSCEAESSEYRAFPE